MRLFVYGTLMRGGSRHHLLAGQQFLGPACTAACLALYDLGAYPGLVRHEPNGRAVAGELYDIDPGLVPTLDHAEGAPALYQLEEIELADGKEPAFSYIYQRDVSRAPLIVGNRWNNCK